MQAKPLATNLGEQANKIAVSVQSGDGEVLTLWGMCRRAFSTWYTIQLRAVFVEAYGMRTKRTREDPLNKFHLSLDTPLDENEDGSFTIADVLPDEAAEEGEEGVVMTIPQSAPPTAPFAQGSLTEAGENALRSAIIQRVIFHRNFSTGAGNCSGFVFFKAGTACCFNGFDDS